MLNIIYFSSFYFETGNNLYRSLDKVRRHVLLKIEVGKIIILLQLKKTVVRVVGNDLTTNLKQCFVFKQ
jgi:hypothetical protein